VKDLILVALLLDRPPVIRTQVFAHNGTHAKNGRVSTRLHDVLANSLLATYPLLS